MRITDVLIPLLFLLGLGVMAWQLTKQKKDRDKVLFQLAANRGWHYLPGKEGGRVDHQHPEERNRLFTLEGVTDGGVNWRLESRGKLQLKGQGILPAQTRMSLEQVGSVTMMLIPDPGTQLPAGMISRFLESYGLNLASKQLKHISMPEGTQLKYCLYGTDEVNVSLLLDPLTLSVTAWLEKWPAARQPVLLGGSESGLHLNWGIEKPEDVTALVALGEKWSEGLQNLESAT